MKKLSLITLLLILSQVANATMYLTDSKGVTHGPYKGDCKDRRGYDGHFKCTALPHGIRNTQFKGPREAHDDDRGIQVYRDSRTE